MARHSHDQLVSAFAEFGRTKADQGRSLATVSGTSDADLARREARIRAMAEEQARRESERMKALRKRGRMSRPTLAIAVLSIVGLAGIVGLVFFLIHSQSIEQQRQARAAAARQKAMEEQMSQIRAGQAELRRLNRERDALLAKLTEGMAADRAAVVQKLDAIEAKRKALADKLAQGQHRADHKGRHRGGHRGTRTKTEESQPKTMAPLDRRYDVLPD